MKTNRIMRIAKIADKILAESRIRFSSTAEQIAEEVLMKVIKGTKFSGHVFSVGGFVRDEMLAKMFPGKVPPPKDLDVVVEIDGGAGMITKFLHEILKNKDGSSATHRPHLLGSGYPIWALHFRDDDSGNVELDGRVYPTAGAEIEFADTQKERFLDDKSRQRVTEFATLEEDIKRRDFTVNMLIKDLTSGKVRDVTGVSLKHLEEGILDKHPDVDFAKIITDDPLRTLRLVRFAVKNGWSIPEEIKQSVRENLYVFNQKVSDERVWGEFEKILKAGKIREALALAKDLGFDKIEVDSETGHQNALTFLMQKLESLEMRHESEHHIDTPDKKDDKIIDHTLNVVDEAKKTVEAQLAALLHDIGKPLARAVEEDGRVKFKKHEEAGLEVAEEILRKFKLDAKTIKKVLSLVKNHMRPHSLEGASAKALRKFIRDMGEDLDDVLDMAEADSRGKNPPNDYVHKLRRRIKEIQNAKIPPVVKSVIDGREIMDILNIKGGPVVGNAKKFVLDLQDENPELTKEEAAKAIKEAYSKGELD